MVMAIASKETVSVFGNSFCSILPGLFLHKWSTSCGPSLFRFERWPDLRLRCCSKQTSRCLRCDNNNASVSVQGIPSILCKSGEERVTDGGLLRLKDDDEERVGILEKSPEQYSGVPHKIWMRKQSRTRALALNTVTKAGENDGADCLAVESKEVERKTHGVVAVKKRWFPHEDAFQVTEGTTVSSGEIAELLDPFMSEDRKQTIERVVHNRTYSVCTVVEGLSDVGNVSAICRTADAMGFQAIHVISNKHTVRYRENQRTSAGAEKWLDMETWGSTESCIEALKARGYRIAVTHIADDTVSVHDMDWTVPTAIVLGNEHRGISENAIALSDVRCSIPMAGMVESFNVSVAAAIILHHAAMDRKSRVGFHGDLTEEERRIMLAVFYMRHRDDTKSILTELVNRKYVDAALKG